MEPADTDLPPTGRPRTWNKRAGLAVLVSGLIALFGLRCVEERSCCRVCGAAKRRDLVSFCIPFTQITVVSTPLSSRRLDEGYLSSLLDPGSACNHSWRVYHRDARCLFFSDLGHPVPYPCAGKVSDVAAFRDYLVAERPEALRQIQQALQDGHLLVVSSTVSREEYRFQLARQDGRTGLPCSGGYQTGSQFSAGGDEPCRK